MSYFVVQKIKNYHYLYEVESKWDPVKKQPYQKRRYIGRCDEQGNLTEKKADKVTGRQFGPFYLRFRILAQEGLDRVFSRLYGIDNGKLLEGVSILTSTHTMSPESYLKELKRTTIPDLLGLKGLEDWDKQSLDLLIHNAYISRTDLFKSLVNGESEAFAFISEFEVPREDLEYFSNDFSVANGKKHKRYLLIAVGRKYQLPFCYSLYEESDYVTMMGDFTKKIKDLGIYRVSFVVKGLSDLEIASLFRSGLNIISSVRRFGTIANNIWNKGFDEIDTDCEEDASINRNSGFLKMGEMNAMVFVMFSKNKFSSELNKLNSRRRLLESQLKNTIPSDENLKRLCGTLGTKDLYELYSVYREKNDAPKYHLNSANLQKRESICGRTIYLTNTRVSSQDISELMSLYDMLDYEASRTQTAYFSPQSIFTTQDNWTEYFLAEFMKNVVSITLFQRMKRDTPIISVETLMSEINSIRLNFVNDKTYLDSLSEVQEKLFVKMGVRPPTNSIVRKIDWDRSPGI